MATRAPLDQSFLADLVERRIEAPEVEYKRWMPLTDNVERANIARHTPISPPIATAGPRPRRPVSTNRPSASTAA
jgi:hypothetical protein